MPTPPAGTEFSAAATGPSPRAVSRRPAARPPHSRDPSVVGQFDAAGAARIHGIARRHRQGRGGPLCAARPAVSGGIRRDRRDSCWTIGASSSRPTRRREAVRASGRNPGRGIARHRFLSPRVVDLGVARAAHRRRQARAPLQSPKLRFVECSYRARVTPAPSCIARYHRAARSSRAAGAARIESVGRLAGGSPRFQQPADHDPGYTELLLMRRERAIRRDDLEGFKSPEARPCDYQQLLAFGGSRCCRGCWI